MDPFIIKSLFSVFLGVIWVTISTIIAERVNGKLAGLIAGFPSTAVVSLLFIGLTQSYDTTLSVTTIIPFNSALYCFFFLAYGYFSVKSFSSGLIAGLITWFICAFISHEFGPTDFYLSSALWFIIVASCITIALKTFRIDKKKIPKKIAQTPFWLKISITAVALSAVIITSALAGPKWGIVFSTFPAITISTFLITIKSGGVEFTRQIGLNILLSATTTVGIFGILAHLLLPFVGVYWGIAFAYLLLMVISYLLYLTIFEKLKQ
jgi:hypothetical protein